MGIQEKTADDLLEKFKKSGILFLSILLPLLFVFIVIFGLWKRNKNDVNYYKYGTIKGLVVEKRINEHKKNRYEISIEAEPGSGGQTIIEGSKRYVYEITNDSVFKLIEPRDFFIKRQNESICSLVKNNDTVIFDPISGIYSTVITTQ